MQNSINPECLQPQAGNGFPAVARQRGFSLIEVVIAIGIVSFCLVAILGLFSTGFMTGQRARDYTSLAVATSSIMSQVRSGITNAPATLYFDSMGQTLPDINNATYKCVVSTSVTTVGMGGVGTLTNMQLQFFSPATSATNLTISNVICPLY